MFIEFFFYLRQRGIAVSITEWMTLMEALAAGLHHSSLLGFYHLCRALCVKRASQFDLYDQCFGVFFEGVEADEADVDKVLEWLRDPVMPRALTPEEQAMLEALSLDELRRQFEERLAEQNERHDRGNRWVGTGGTSPFGHSGQHPSGVRVGGTGGNSSALQVASQRRFRNLRSDVVLDVRQIGVALKQLRRLARDGRPDQLDLDATIDETARNAGDIELVFQPQRKNTVKLLLLMDVGGSMTPYTRLCERLFSAAHAATHFKAFKSYYFHNCPYDNLYTDMSRYKAESTAQVLRDLDRQWFCVIVGDAAMSPYELTAPGGAVDYFQNNPDPGITWLNRIHDRFPRSVWLNPEPIRYWNITSTRLIRNVFEMFPLTLEGLEQSIAHLRQTPI